MKRRKEYTCPLELTQDMINGNMIVTKKCVIYKNKMCAIINAK